MSVANLTVRADESAKKEFGDFCGNAGLNAAPAVNRFIKTAACARMLPFAVTDTGDNGRLVMARMKRAVKSMREKSLRNGSSNMSLDEINAEINASRLSRRLG